MMEEEIGDDGVIGNRSRRTGRIFGCLEIVENIGLNGFNLVAELLKLRAGCGDDEILAVEKGGRRGGDRGVKTFSNFKEKSSIAGADFEDFWLGRIWQEGLQGIGHESSITHPGIEAAEITAGADGAGIVGRQVIE